MFSGSIVALVTPFNFQGLVNLEKLKELVRYHIERKTKAVLILGTTGESPTITPEERRSIIRAAVATSNKRIPIIVGAGSNCTIQSIILAQEAEQLGADGLLLVSPYYNKGNLAGIIKHFEAIANGVSRPCILYNVPSRTGSNIPLEAIEQLAKHPNIIGIKEASGDISYAMKVSRFLSLHFTMWSGNDDIVIPLLAIGATGVISVSANVIPNETQEMIDAFMEGDLVKAREIQMKYMDLINALFVEVNPIPIKTLMNFMGGYVGHFRLPLTQCTIETEKLIFKIIEQYDLGPRR